MKKKMLAMVMGIIALSASAALVAGSTWRVIDDSGCNRCIITDSRTKCGQCGSFMRGQGLEKSNKGYRFEQTYICSNANCRHSVRGGAR